MNFDYEYFGIQYHNPSIFQPYIRHNISVFFNAEFKGVNFEAIFQTACSHIGNDLNAPNPRLEFYRSNDNDRPEIIDYLLEIEDSELEEYIEEITEEAEKFFNENFKQHDEEIKEIVEKIIGMGIRDHELEEFLINDSLDNIIYWLRSYTS